MDLAFRHKADERCIDSLQLVVDEMREPTAKTNDQLFEIMLVRIVVTLFDPNSFFFVDFIYFEKTFHSLLCIQTNIASF